VRRRAAPARPRSRRRATALLRWRCVFLMSTHGIRKPEACRRQQRNLGRQREFVLPLAPDACDAQSRFCAVLCAAVSRVPHPPLHSSGGASCRRSASRALRSSRASRPPCAPRRPSSQAGASSLLPWHKATTPMCAAPHRAGQRPQRRALQRSRRRWRSLKRGQRRRSATPQRRQQWRQTSRRVSSSFRRRAACLQQTRIDDCPFVLRQSLSCARVAQLPCL
jgi:hypothetical protein